MLRTPRSYLSFSRYVCNFQSHAPRSTKVHPWSNDVGSRAPHSQARVVLGSDRLRFLVAIATATPCDHADFPLGSSLRHGSASSQQGNPEQPVRSACASLPGGSALTLLGRSKHGLKPRVKSHRGSFLVRLSQRLRRANTLSGTTFGLLACG